MNADKSNNREDAVLRVGQKLYDKVVELEKENKILREENHDLKNKYAVLLSDYNDLKNQGNIYNKAYTEGYYDGAKAGLPDCDCGQPSCAICHG